MNFIKKYKLRFVITIFLFVFLIVVFFGIKNLLYSNNGNNEYGNRLDGIKEVLIDNSVIESIKKNILDTGKVETITYHLKGKIMQFNIDVKKEVDLNSGKSVADKILEGLSDDIKKFYDVQVFLTSKQVEGETLYPVIGSKHKTRVIFSWNNTKVGE